MARYNAHGTQLQVGDGGDPEAFTSIAQVRDIGGPNLSTNTVTASDHDSGGIVSKLPGLKDGGQVTFDVNLDPAHATHDGATGIAAYWASRETKNWKLVFPDAGDTEWAFSGFIVGLNPSAPVDDALTAAITIEVVGAPTFG